MRKVFNRWLAPPNSSSGKHILPGWLALPRDPRLWAVRRHSVALGAAIGAAVSVIPLPVQIPIAVASAVWLRVHVATAAAATLLSNPLTIVPMWAAAWKIGCVIVPTQDARPPAFSFDAGLPALEDLLDAIAAVGPPMLIGLPVLGAAFGLAAYLIVVLAWRFTGAARGRINRPVSCTEQ